jgi:hypothetical protein
MSAMQEAYCVIDKSGFRFTVQKSNCLQANVYLKKDLFTRFECEVSKMISSLSSFLFA